MATTLDPTNPFGNFKQDGTQTVTPGPVLAIADQNVGDFAVLFATDFDATAGTELDVVATFQVLSTLPNNADAGNRVAINDGTHAAIAACVIQNGVNGIGLLSTGSTSDPTSYPVFVAVDWQAAPVTIRLRRTATGDAELIEVNGVAPSPRALLTADKAAPQTRPGTTVEFGAASPEARCTVNYIAFRSEKVAQPVAGKLNCTRLRLNDADSTDRVRFRADYTLGTGSNGIDPTTEQVTLKLSTAAGQFYPTSPDFNPLTGFDVKGVVGKRRWTLNDATRTTSGIEQLAFDEDPASGSGGPPTGAVVLRDLKTTLATMDFSTVNLEVTVGTDKLVGTATMVEKPAGSGKWRLKSE
jgi:hypothetical protein